MNATNLIMVLVLFLTINSTNGVPPNCHCRRANHTDHCLLCGCSNGTNAQCNTGSLYDNNYAALALGFSYRGCNCPGNPFNVRFNAFYSSVDIYTYTFNYTNCTNFGTNARDADGRVPANANNAIDCCNFCCGRNDPPIKSKATITTTSGY